MWRCAVDNVAGALVVLDLDETVIMAGHGGPCALATAAGIKVGGSLTG